MPRTATLVEKAYLAGLIDGEGCVGATQLRDKRPGRGPGVMFTVFVSMCDRECVDLLVEIYGGSIRVRDPKKARHRLVYTWQGYGEIGASLLRDTLPFLRLKKGQAEAYIAARVSFTGGPKKGVSGSVQPSAADVALRQDCFKRIRELNGRRGSAVQIASAA
jgi:hypothetical protein